MASFSEWLEKGIKKVEERRTKRDNGNIMEDVHTRINEHLDVIKNQRQKVDVSATSEIKLNIEKVVSNINSDEMYINEIVLRDDFDKEDKKKLTKVSYYLKRIEISINEISDNIVSEDDIMKSSEEDHSEVDAKENNIEQAKQNIDKYIEEINDIFHENKKESDNK